MITLLKTAAGMLRQMLKDMESIGVGHILLKLKALSDFIQVLLSTFKKSCNTHQLVDLTVSCLKHNKKLLNAFNEENFEDDNAKYIIYYHIVEQYNQLFEDIYD